MVENVLVHEPLVIDLVQEYMERNRQFNMDKIIPYLSSRFAKSSVNVSKVGINLILKSLIEKNIIVERSSLTKENIFTNQNRKEIYDFIMNNPGAYFNKIVKKLKLTIPVVEWHLNVLLKFSFIRQEKINSHQAYFDLETDIEEGIIIHILRREKVKRIIEFFESDNEGYTKSELSQELSMHPNTITKYLDRLEKYRIIHKKKSGRYKHYFLNKKYYYDKFKNKL